MRSAIAVAILVTSTIQAPAQDATFNGLVGRENCAVEQILQCKGGFCSFVETGLPAGVSIDFSSLTYATPPLDDTGPIEVVETSAAKLRQPLWIRFKFTPAILERYESYGVLALDYDDQFKSYSRSLTFTTKGLFEDPEVEMIASGRCERG